MKTYTLPLLASSLSLLTTSRHAAVTDTVVTNQTAWRFLRTGIPSVPHSWIHDATANEYHSIHGHWMSDRMPGMILTLVPFQAFSAPTALSFMLAAFVATAVTVYLVQRLYGFDCAVIACIATPLLNANKELWPQTVLIAVILLGLLLIDEWQFLWLLWPLTTYAFLVRPPFAVALCGIFAIAAYARPRVVAYGLAGIATGALGLLLWTRFYFDRWGLTGGYAVDGHKAAPFLDSLYVGLLSPQRGILFYTPWVLAVFLVNPTRTRNIAFLLLAYTVAEWWQYNAFGGDGFLGYRYSLPFVIFAIPCLTSVLNRFWLALLAWSGGICIWILLRDQLQYANVARNPNVMPLGMIVSGVITTVVTFSVYEYKRSKRHAV